MYGNFHSLDIPISILLAISIAGTCTLSNRLAAHDAISSYWHNGRGNIRISQCIDTLAGENSSRV